MTQNQKNGRIVNIRFVCIISDYAERNLIIEIMDMVRVRCPGLVISQNDKYTFEMYSCNLDTMVD